MFLHLPFVQIFAAHAEKWHGLKDVELRHRQRYLDWMDNPEVRNVFMPAK